MSHPRAESASDYERLALADDLHLTRDRHLLTVATSRWEPGVFLYDLEYLAIEAKPVRSGMAVALGSRGAHVNFQVLRFTLDAKQFARFETFAARLREQREHLRLAR